jgi:hypothetical protein
MSESPTDPPPESPASAEPDDFEAREFEPVPLRRRVDGWTPERQADFIQALAESACVAEACRAVGMSERSAYALRARADAVSFRNAWDAALDYSLRRLSDAVLSRAINGVAVPVFFRGEQIGEKRFYDERLAMFLLRRRDPARYGNWRDRVEWHGHPEAEAIALARGKMAVREDADAEPAELGKRLIRRLREIVHDLLRAARLERSGGPFAGDVS